MDLYYDYGVASLPIVWTQLDGIVMNVDKMRGVLATDAVYVTGYRRSSSQGVIVSS